MLPSRSKLLKLELEFRLLTLLLNGDWNCDFGGASAPLLVLPLSRYAVVLLRLTFPFVAAWPLVCLADLVDHDGDEDLGLGAREGYTGLEFEV